MALNAGARLGPYEILGCLGAGGMGEVYRARDVKLHRDVAIKVLPESFATDPERLMRFEREAQTLAALNHPHIAHIHGLEEQGDLRALVMELVEGESLAARLARGRLPVDEALAVARQMVDALDAAHEKGIIHRDLKPANIMLTEDGQVKVLDFGLAKVIEAEQSGSVANSPTLTFGATQAGMILGTAAYMSPEQAKGRAADKRSDVWGFGCVLYEMLTGRRAFEGEDISDTLAAVLRGDPDWARLPPGIPTQVRTVLRRCLEKDRKARIPDVSVVRFLLAETGAAGEPASGLPPPRTRWQLIPWAVAIIASAVALAALLWPLRPRTVEQPALRLNADLGAAATLGSSYNTGAAAVLSPDGSILAFVAQKPGARPQLFIRKLTQLDATPLATTEDAEGPFFSPDGQWLAFFAAGKLKKISVTGGSALTVCDVPLGRGGSWADDGSIVYSPSNARDTALWRVSSAGGKPEPLTKLVEGEVTHRFPHVLPGSKAVLYMAHSTTGVYDDANIVVQALPTGVRKVLVRGGYYPRFARAGYLLFMREGMLHAARMDIERLELTSPAAAVLQDVGAGFGGGAQYALSDSGTLVYATGEAVTAAMPIEWMDRAGKLTPLRAIPANWSNPAFSPDGRMLAMDIVDGSPSEVWVYEWERDTLSRLTSNLFADFRPTWTPDGQRIAFMSLGGGLFNLFWQRADGSGDAQRLTESSVIQAPSSWHPSRPLLAFAQQDPETSWDLMVLPIEGDETRGWKPGAPTVLLKTPALEEDAIFSPDGRWFAYTSTESGRPEVYVRPFPGPGPKSLISTTGGSNPHWSRTRSELFYANSSQLMVAGYRVEGGSFRADKPQAVSPVRMLQRARPTPYRSFAVHPDGERLALSRAPDVATELADKVIFVFNFVHELQRATGTKN